MKTLPAMLLAALLCCAACGEDFAPECASDMECPQGSCDAGRGVCAYAAGSCAADADCAGGQSCVGATAEARGACMFPAGSCAADTDCGATQRCEGASADARGTCLTISCSTQPDPDAFCAAARPRATCNLNTGACIPPELECLDSGECGADEVCEANVCVSADCTSKGDPAGFCAALEPGSVCVEATRRCGPRPPYTHILIQDLSSGAACTERMNGYSSPGVDITEVLLLGGAEILGGGVVRGYMPGQGANNLNETDVFNRPPDAYTATGCVTTVSPRTVLSLGCGGSVTFGFVDRAGAPVPLTGANRLFIGEHGPLCDDNPDLLARLDRYQVSLCDDAGGVSRCDEPVGGGRILNRSETIALSGM